jgi:DNA-binding transcriptional LysR family regulator
VDIKRLSHIVALANLRSFSRAAEHVHLSQPALTRSIQTIEAEFGLRLFDRGAEVTVTPAGEFILERARRLLSDASGLKRDVDLYRQRQLGDISFGSGSFAAATMLASLLANLRQEYPGVNLRIEISNCSLLLRRLIDGDIEFIVGDTEEVPFDKTLSVEALPPEPTALYVRVGHPLRAQPVTTLVDVWRYGLASGRIPATAAAIFAPLIDRPPGDCTRIALECDDIELLKKIALDSDVVAAIPCRAVEHEPRDGLHLLAVQDLAPLFSATGIVTVRHRTLAPMAGVILERLRALPAISSPTN